jgi:hypothetical protein
MIQRKNRGMKLMVEFRLVPLLSLPFSGNSGNIETVQ